MFPITMPRKEKPSDKAVSLISRLPQFEKADKLISHDGKLIVITDIGNIYSIDIQGGYNEYK